MLSVRLPGVDPAVPWTLLLGQTTPRPSAWPARVPRLPSALKPVLGGQKLLVLLLRRFQGDPVSKMARGSFAGIKSPAVTSFPFPGLKLSHEAPLFPDARWSSAAAPGACRRPPLQCATETVSASAARESPFLSSRRLFSVNCWAAAARRPSRPVATSPLPGPAPPAPPRSVPASIGASGLAQNLLANA